MSSTKYPKVVGFELVRQIGGGGFSTVFEAVNVADHRVAACKVIAITDSTTEKERKTIDKEMRVHAALKHVNVLEFLNAVVVEPKHKHHYVPGFYMLLEYAAGGDLFDKIAPDIGVPDDVAHLYFNQLIEGMGYIHREGVCHRDLKPENLLLDVTGTLKISDFGLSSVYKLKETGKTRMLSERCGSLPYVAPELAIEVPYQAEPIDVWGVGVILFTLLGGNTPWDEPTHQSPEFCRYLTGEIFNEAPWNRFSPDALDLIRGLLTVDPNERMTLTDAGNHPWCMRPSQLARMGPASLAEALTAPLRKNGDLDFASPDFLQPRDVENDGDEIMLSATRASQFTQSLMLFSQTQNGNRYTPHLTRFYASTSPAQLCALVKQSLESFNVTCKLASSEDGNLERLRIGGYDRRKVVFKGWVEIEKFAYRGNEGSFCVMQRNEGSPISWRQLWKALIQSSQVAGYVLRK